ncbi:WxL domain-containing protein [Carnobacterium maltaromaticum]|uniref:WxL domain-containing protein n=1 Tax=Carnobacterium maltaromaticum TaxID=2751 RepID=UPI0009C4C0D7|nr:WxL domain-containing protein [Carnobacterium maltaromaticum]MBC9809092.1 WxL domain-containing protein [Carnobacterium maltaromaticum]CRH23261.1 Cell surface protein with WxL domain [Carnobacterium maltaromaticum]
MKLVNLATVAVLSVGVFAVGGTAFAEEAREVETNGQITFIPNDEEELVVVPPETEGPDVEIPPSIPGTTGPLSIVYVPTMSFGLQKISNQNQTYEMIAEMHELKDGSGKAAYTSFAQVQDIRGNNEGWKLMVTASEFTSDTANNVLTGARISLLSPAMNYSGDKLNSPTVHEDTLVLNPGESTEIMSASEGNGAGISSVIWGDQAYLDASTDTEVRNKFIKLFVPGSTVKDATVYNASLNWELSTTPGNSI